MSGWSEFEVKRVKHERPEVLIYRMSGVLSDSKPAYAFLAEFREEVSDAPHTVVINLKGVPHINSGGVGILAACFTSVTNAGGRMCLVGLQKRGRTVMQVVGLTKVIECHESESEILQHLGAEQ